MNKIMFNDKYGLTRAVLDGRKTMTRRIIDYSKNKVFLDLLGDENYMKHEGTLSYDYKDDVLRIDDDFDCYILRPYYKIGEEVAIAQAYNDFFNDEYNPTLFPEGAGWTNKLFVKAELMPYRIRITNVKVERLQDISDDACLKEGIYKDSGDDEFPPSIFYEFEGNKDNGFDTPREAFASLIEGVSGRGTWEYNPWVLAYEFELIK